MDIVERLRKYQCPTNKGCNSLIEYCQCNIMDDSADEIERLREALKNMSCSCDDECYYKYDICPHKMAANALKEKE